MKQNLEIEFKSFLSEEKYNELLQKFHLEDKIFMQTNHYFDTSNLDLLNNKVVLRIRQKNDNYKLTSKVKHNEGDLETHVKLTKDEAIHMLSDGFDSSVINLNYNVHKVSELSTYRVSMPYKSGVIFLDKSVYYGVTDYEVEFEVEEFNQGKIDFDSFINENDIEYEKSIKKVQRAFSQIKK